jgi:hypothetical protein
MARRGVIWLGWHLDVHLAVLGKSFQASADELAFTVYFPRVPEPPYEVLNPHLLPPLDFGWANSVADMWGNANWMGDPDALIEQMNASVGYLGVEFEETDLSVDEIGTRFDAWYRVVCDWIEVWTDQWVTREDEAQEFGSYGTLDEYDPETGGRPQWRRRDREINLGVPASMQDVQSAFDYASADRGLPEFWFLLTRARRSTNPRRAVIDAGTAVEVCLAQEVHRRLGDIPEAASERIIAACNGMVGLVRLLEDMDQTPPSESRWKRVADRLANPRNLAAHAGEQPLDKHADAVAEAAAIIDHYAPLPRPGEGLV